MQIAGGFFLIWKSETEYVSIVVAYLQCQAFWDGLFCFPQNSFCPVALDVNQK